MKSLAARAGCSENTFRKWVQPWIRLGVVVAIPRPGDGSGALTTLHILRPSVYWNSFDRKPGQTFENPEPSEGEAKRNSEPNVPHYTPSSSSGSDAFSGDCDSVFNPEHSGQSWTSTTKSESPKPENPNPEFVFQQAPEHPDENVIFERIALSFDPWSSQGFILELSVVLSSGSVGTGCLSFDNADSGAVSFKRWVSRPLKQAPW